MARLPLWKSISDALRRDISDGRYARGAKLPTEAELSARFGVNRHTVRHALSVLADEGLVYTRRGAGAFVAADVTEYPIGRRVRFHQNLRAAGREPEKRRLTVEQRTSTQKEADALDLETGAPVLEYLGLSLSDAVPIAIFSSVFPITRLPGLVEILKEVTSVTEALRHVGVADYTRSSTRLTAIPADASQALHLRIAQGAPLLRSQGVNVSAGVPVEYGTAWFAGERTALVLDEELLAP